MERSDERIRVTLVGTLPPLLGVSEVCLGLLEALKNRVKLDFFSFKKLFPAFLHPAKRTMSDEPPYQGEVEVHYLISYCKPWTWGLPAMLGKGEILHLQWWTTFLFPFYSLLLVVARLKKKRIVLQVHNVLPHEARSWDRLVTWFIFKMADRIILHTERMREMCLFHFPEMRDRIRVIPYGPLSLYPDPRVSKNEAKRSIGIPQESKVILFFGNIRPYKGVETLLKAYSGILAELPQAYLLVAGRVWGDKGPWQALVKSLGIEERTKFIADYIRDDQVPLLFRASDIVVLPYLRFDSLSGVAMLALGFGKALLLSDVGALREIAPHPDALFKPGDPSDLKGAILKVLLDDDLRGILEKRGRELARRFSWDRVSDQLLEMYRELL